MEVPFTIDDPRFSRRQGARKMNFDRSGYTIVEQIVSEAECEDLIAALPPIEKSGSRLLLSQPLFRQVASGLRSHKRLAKYFGELVAVQCIHFRKSAEHNWAVTLHRDSILPVAGEGKWLSAGIKEGLSAARPSREFMDRCVAVRVHLDGAPVEDISVIPGSHLDDHKHDRGKAVPISVSRGGALVLRPTLAHASSKLRDQRERRVLHYVFAPKELPYGYSWHAAA